MAEYEAQERPQRPERVRPRRLEPDTLSYLKEVTEMLTQAGEDADDVELLLWNVLEELAPRAASAASDRHAGELLEVFLPKMSDAQLRFLLHKMAGYMSHLWTNRYSSHVLQHLLSRASVVVAKEVDGTEEEEEDERMEEIPPMSHIIVNVVKEVENEWITLMNDVSASHVLRSVLAVLAGKPLVPEKRGKKAKHRVVTFTEARPGKDGSEVTYDVPDSFEKLFKELLAVLIQSSTQELQNLLYDQNSGPLIASALKLAPSKSRRKLAEHILQWEDEESCENGFFDLAGDSVTSHLLEALFESASDKFFTKVFERCIRGKMLGLAEHNIANYVVQHAIMLVRTEALALEVLEELESSLWTLLTMGRPGVIWRVVEMCVKFKLHQKEVFEALVNAVAKQESKKPEAVRKNFVASLLNVQLSTSATSAKVQVNVMGAKIIEQMQQFEAGEYLTPLYKGILSFNSAQLMALAKDSTGSRCVIEPIWESKDQSTAWVRGELYERFAGKFGTLAMDRLGAFSVMKCYEDLPLDKKEAVVHELLEVEAQLSGSHFSELVMNTCHLFEYKQSREKWEALYSKQKKIADLFRDVVKEEALEEGRKTHKHKKDKKVKKRKAAQLTEEEADQIKEEVAKSADVAMIMDVLRSGASDKGKKSKKTKKSKKHRMHEED
ncbi:ARM repeat-containing protein [Phytophthora palmivora]|uniref:ARM repeat-containing protein n=1 Tax=Phytophthora palmivora TaxID=4796 RepID=A0A2P4YDP6_9STRA|nr:ARM repeat-containing protein [Phytophthora palmivora]